MTFGGFLCGFVFYQVSWSLKVTQKVVVVVNLATTTTKE